MNLYAVTIGNHSNYGGYFKTGLLAVEADDIRDAWTQAAKRCNQREKVLYVERVEPIDEQF